MANKRVMLIIDNKIWFQIASHSKMLIKEFNRIWAQTRTVPKTFQEIITNMKVDEDNSNK